MVLLTREVIKSYLFEVLGIKIRIALWEKRDGIPFFLSERYDFYESSLLNQQCLLIVVKEDVEYTPATLKKHAELIEKQSNMSCIFVFRATTSYNRKRFIQHQISFIVPGNQLYIPEFGVDLREYFRGIKMTREHFSPATQVVIIYALFTQSNSELTASQLSKKLGYTPMTMSRVFDELVSSGVGHTSQKGRERLLSFPENKNELWEQAKPFMKSPLKRRIWAKGEIPNFYAGLSALSKKSMLGEPPIPVYAMGFDKWKKSDITMLPDRDGAEFALEIWNYDPSLFAQNGCVDSFSLFLSFDGSEDERVEAALEEMMEKVNW